MVDINEIYNPSKTKFRPATIEDYVSWLKGYVQRHPHANLNFSDSSFERVKDRFVVALEDFTTGFECGVNARNIIVPYGINYLGLIGERGHNRFYFEEDYDTCDLTRIVVFNDREFREAEFGDFIDKSKRKIKENEKRIEILKKYDLIYGRDYEKKYYENLDATKLEKEVSDLGVFLVASTMSRSDAQDNNSNNLTHTNSCKWHDSSDKRLFVFVSSIATLLLALLIAALIYS